MAEALIVKEQSVTYEGIFDLKGLNKVVRNWSSDKGYWLREVSQTESLKEEGKYLELYFDAQKKITDYVRLHMDIFWTMSNVKDVTVTRDDKKVKLKEGSVNFHFKAIVQTDYEGRWEGKPIWYFLRTLMHKYVLHPYVGKYESDVKKDLEVLKNNLQSFLNMSKFTQ